MIRPIGERLLVKLPSAEKPKATNGIILPDSIKGTETKSKGEVISLGGGAKDTGVEKGNIILFGKHAGEEVELNECKYKILNIKDVLAIID